MSADALQAGVFRYLHVIAAALAVGSLFFMRVILPRAIDHLDPATRDDVFSRARQVFKRLIHTCILLLLLSGVLNSIRLFPQYNAAKGVLHALWGMHLLLGLIVIAISIWLLAGNGYGNGARSCCALSTNG